MVNLLNIQLNIENETKIKFIIEILTKTLVNLEFSFKVSRFKYESITGTALITVLIKLDPPQNNFHIEYFVTI